MNKEVSLNVSIGTNRPYISKVGSSLGCSYSKPEASSCLPDYDKKITLAKENGIDITLSRAARKFRIKTVDVLSTKITQDLDGTVIVLVNEGMGDDELRIPVNSDMTKAGIVTDDAVAKALKGEDSNIHFSDIEKLAKILNTLNQNEKTRLIKIKEDVELAIKRIESAIAENLKKVETYKHELNVDGSKTVLETSDGTVQINVHD